jgi:hypothetical protein
VLTRTRQRTTNGQDAGTTDLRPTPTGSDRQEPPPTRGPGRAPLRWVTILIALAALVAVAVQLGAVGGDRSADGPVVTEPNPPAVGSQEFLARLAEQGYIPPQTVDRERLLLERLVEQGRIPAETLD